MAKVQSLNVPYGGYITSEIPKEDEEHTHVGPRTPCGEYLRRFWQPLVFMEELKDLPVRVRIVGEDLVAFRDRRGQVGVLHLHCSHRGASLEFGQIAEQGIRCCYHGWHFDVDGRILDTPGERRDSPLKDHLFHGAYPIHVHEGLVFVYMGPPDKKPAFPIIARATAVLDPAEARAAEQLVRPGRAADPGRAARRDRPRRHGGRAEESEEAAGSGGEGRAGGAMGRRQRKRRAGGPRAAAQRGPGRRSADHRLGQGAKEGPALRATWTYSVPGPSWTCSSARTHGPPGRRRADRWARPGRGSAGRVRRTSHPDRPAGQR